MERGSSFSAVQVWLAAIGARWKAVRFQGAILLVTAALVAGCGNDHFKRGRGEVGPFILQQARARGGSPATNSLPAITGSWRYKEDQYGVIIHMSRDQFPAVQAFLRKAFGTPQVDHETSKDLKLGMYRLSAKGGAIQFTQDADKTQIIVLRPMSAEETVEAVSKVLREMGKNKSP